MPPRKGPLAATRVLCAGVADDLLRELRQIVRELGGYWQEQLIPRDLPHVFVTTTVMSDMYKIVTDGGARIPVVDPQWILACKKYKEMVPMTQYTLGPLAGMLICISGGNVKTKQQQVSLITGAGGRRTPELTKQVTHLIINRPLGPGPREPSLKEQHAFIWEGIAVVWEDWLQSTVRAGVYRRDEADFAVPRIMPASQEQEQEGVQQQQHEEQPAEARVLTHTPAQPAATRLSTAPPLPSGMQPAPVLARPAPAAALDEDDDDPFLEGVRYCLVASTAAEEAELLHIGRLGGAARYPGLVPQLTHVVVGSDEQAAPSTYTKVKDFVAGSAPQCSVVRADWLRECAVRRETLPSDVRFGLDAADLSILARGIRRSRDAGLSNDGLSNLSNLPGPSQNASQLPAGGRTAFKGCWFTLAAMAGKEADLHNSRNIILQNSGKVFNANMLALIKNIPTSMLFAICPVSLPNSHLDALLKQPQFRAVPEGNRVTMPWLDLSVDHGRLVKVTNAPAFIMCRPLPHVLPLLHAERIRVAGSQLEPEEQNVLHQITVELGGKFCTTLGKRTTHLVVPCSGGHKFKAAGPRGIKPVTPAWVIDSARAGRFLPESNYYPPDPLPGEVHPEATQFNMDAATQNPTQAAPSRQPSTFAGIGALAKQAPPVGMPQRSALDDLEFRIGAAPVQHSHEEDAAEGTLPVTRPQTSRLASARPALPSCSSDRGSLLDTVADSRPSAEEEFRVPDDSSDLLDQLAARPSPSHRSLAGSRPAPKAPITLPAHVRNRMHRSALNQHLAEQLAEGSGGTAGPATAPADAEQAESGQAQEGLAKQLGHIGSLLEKSAPDPMDVDDALLNHSAPPGDGMGRELSDPSESLPSRPGSAACEDDTGSKPPRRRPRHATGLGDGLPQQHAKRLATDAGSAFAGTQMDFSQQVGYDHTANTEMPALGQRRRSSRLGEASSGGSGGLDHHTFKERLAKAAATQRRQSSKLSS